MFKKCSNLFLFFFAISFAGEKYGVYDSYGSRISTFEADRHDLPEKARQIKAMYPNKNLYISYASKGKISKPTSRYRYKAETGAYIEASRKETFSVCPDKEIKGTWISEYSVSLNEENCLSLQTPNLAGTIHILFLRNNGKMDTIQVLIDQSYIQMGDYSHKIWVPDSMPSYCRKEQCTFPAYGHYESINYIQPLIVDKTKFVVGDAWHYYSAMDMRFDSNNKIVPFLDDRELKEYPKNEKFEGSRLPYIGYPDEGWRYANERSKKEGLDTAYHIIAKSGYKGKDAFIILGKYYDKDNFIAVDTSSSGYKMPSDEEWIFLMRAGASTKYYWGDDEDSLTVSRYVWVRPIGLKQVALLPPNKFGLYDMAGLTHYEAVGAYNSRIFGDRHETIYQGRKFLYEGRDLYDFGIACIGGGDQYRRTLSPECDFIQKIGSMKQIMERPSTTRICTGPSQKRECVDFDEPELQTFAANYNSFRFLRKTPKLHKLDKF